MDDKARLTGVPFKRVRPTGVEYWTQRYFDKRGVRHDASAPTRAAATKKAREAVAGALMLSTDMRFERLGGLFLEACKAGREGREPLTPNTLRGYENYLRIWLNPRIGRKYVQSLTMQDMRYLMNGLVKDATSRTTAQNALTLAKSILSYAVELEVIAAVPGQSLRIQTDWNAKEDIKRVRIPSVEDMALIEAAARANYMSNKFNVRRAYKRYYPMFMLLRTTGIRIGECLALQWSDFNSTLTRLHVQRSVSIPTEELDEEDRIGRTKTKNGRRTLPISKEAVEVLKVWKESARNEWVFPTKSGVPMNYHNVRNKFWAPLLKTAKVEGYGLHSLRHFYASVLMRKGRYKELSLLLGHHSAAFTMDQYGHLIEDGGEQLDEIADAMSESLSG